MEPDAAPRLIAAQRGRAKLAEFQAKRAGAKRAVRLLGAGQQHGDRRTGSQPPREAQGGLAVAGGTAEELTRALSSPQAGASATSTAASMSDVAIDAASEAVRSSEHGPSTFHLNPPHRPLTPQPINLNPSNPSLASRARRTTRRMARRSVRRSARCTWR